MPLIQYKALRPGQIVRSRATRAPRLVLSAPSRTVGGGLTGISLFRIGHSWTHPNPIASYDAWAARGLFEWTDRRGCSEALATEWYRYWDRLFHAALTGEPLPKRPRWPSEWGPSSPPLQADELAPAAVREKVRKWKRLQRAGEFAPAAYLRRVSVASRGEGST